MTAIIAEGVKPTLAELEKFEEAPEGISIELGIKIMLHIFNTFR
jgi:transcription elongation factor SPT5